MREDKKGRQITDNIIAMYKELAKQGDKGAKGFMCGLRDAAQERKARQAKRKP